MESLESIQERYREICRVCTGTTSQGLQMAGIFETTINKVNANLSEMFSACTALLLSPEDGLPPLICSECLSSLIAAYEFQMQCIKTDTELRQAIHDIAQQIKAPTTPNDIKHRTIKIEVDPATVEQIKLDNIEPKVESNPERYLDEVADANIEHLVESEKSDSDDPEYVAPVAKRSRVSKGPRKRREKPKIVCPVCNKIFDKSYRLRRHINVHNPEGKPYECDICKHRFAVESNLVRHRIKHTDLLTTTTVIGERMTVFKCSECPREFGKQESLSSHLKTHKDTMSQKEFHCEYCPRKFNKLNLMTRHMKIHEESKTHKCTICDRTFALGGQLIDHMNRHKGVKPHVCPYCNKGFQQSCTLKDHIRTHNGETPFLCSECGKSFNNGSNLRQHLLRHTGVKPFQCTECPSRFSCKGGLKSHMGTHTGVKPYICDICGSSFTKTYSLAKHKRIHTGERPYPCEMCDMRFNSSDHVKRHMRTHTGEKPYKCNYCDRAFAQSNDLVKHLRSHVGDNTYQCKQCPAAFRLHSELRAHGKIHFLEQKQLGTNDRQNTDFENTTNTSGSLLPYVKQENELKDDTESSLVQYQQPPQQILQATDLSTDSASMQPIIVSNQRDSLVLNQNCHQQQDSTVSLSRLNLASLSDTNIDRIVVTSGQ